MNSFKGMSVLLSSADSETDCLGHVPCSLTSLFFLYLFYLRVLFLIYDGSVN